MADEKPQPNAPEEAPPLGYGGGEMAGPSCTPEIVGLIPTTQSAVSVECPSGFVGRNGSAPISGRFTTREELVDALCTPIDDKSDPRAIKEDVGIDFVHYDVFATPYDAATRTLPMVNTRSANELWIRVTGSCSTGKSTFATALFVVPKDAKVDEQRCNVSCE